MATTGGKHWGNTSISAEHMIDLALMYDSPEERVSFLRLTMIASVAQHFSTARIGTLPDELGGPKRLPLSPEDALGAARLMWSRYWSAPDPVAG